MRDWTTLQLIKDVKRRGSVPTNQSLYSDQDFVDTFSDCLELRIVPSILRTREELFVTSSDLAVADGQVDFEVPARAIGSRVRSVELIDAADRVVRHIKRLDPQSAKRFANDQRGLGGLSYYFKNNKIVLNHEITDLTLRIRINYYRRPSRLARTASAGRITAVDVLASTITLDNIPSTFAVNAKVDVHNASPQFNAIADGRTISNVSSFTLTLDSVADLAVGQWVCEEGFAVIPQIPGELHQIMIQYAVSKILGSLGDYDGAADADKTLSELERNLYEMLASRDDSNGEAVDIMAGIWGADSGNDWGW